MHNYLWRTLHDNGWKWCMEERSDSKDRSTFTLTILVEYNVKIYARVAMNAEHLRVDGHYGVMWLDAEYEYPMPIEYSEIEQMLYAIEKAEDNLLKIGVPFSNPCFHGKNVANKIRRNDALRRKLNLDEVEEKDYKAFQEFEEKQRQKLVEKS